MEKMVKWMVSNGFFTSPASTRFHGCYVGGLAQHSWDVYQMLLEYHLRLELPLSPGQKPLPLSEDNIAIAALLHDVCKVGAYIPTPDGKNPYK
jgi:23S rRNA maturation-related 3'-5' exoribonuclease YhaM